MWAVFFFKFLKIEMEVTYHTVLVLSIQYNDLICLNIALVNIPLFIAQKNSMGEV